MTYIIIGNLISFVAAIFMGLSCITKDSSRIYLLQSIQCGLLAIASYFFGAYATISTTLLCAARNYITSRGKFTTPVCILFMVLLTSTGLALNNRGLLGLIPILATLIYTICSLVLKDVFAIRCGIIVNLTLWCIYEVLVMDIVSAVTDFIIIIVTIVAIIKDRFTGTGDTAITE